MRRKHRVYRQSWIWDGILTKNFKNSGLDFRNRLSEQMSHNFKFIHYPMTDVFRLIFDNLAKQIKNLSNSLLFRAETFDSVWMHY